MGYRCLCEGLWSVVLYGGSVTIFNVALYHHHVRWIGTSVQLEDTSRIWWGEVCSVGFLRFCSLCRFLSSLLTLLLLFLMLEGSIYSKISGC